MVLTLSTNGFRDVCIWIFPAIATFALCNLWLRMLMNGTLTAMTDVKAAKILPSGETLVSVYTGIPPIDDLITTLVVFFSPLLSHSNPSGRILMLDVLVLLHSALVWLLVDAQRRRDTHWLLRLTAITGLLWNAIGAAVILPLYVFASFGVGSPAAAHVPLAKAKAVLPALLLASYLPMAVAWVVPQVSLEHPSAIQKTIAMLQAGPVYFVVAQTLLSLVLPQIQGTCQRDDDRIAQWWIKAAYMTTAIACALVHVGLIGWIAIAGSSFSVSFTTVYWPEPNAIGGLRDGTMLFMQYDNVFIALTCVLWAWLLLRERVPRVAQRTMLVLPVLSLMCVFLGPGTVMGLTFFWLEGAGNITLD